MSEEGQERMKAWVANWKQTGEELDRLKWEELRAMDFWRKAMPGFALLTALQFNAGANRALQTMRISIC